MRNGKWTMDVRKDEREKWTWKMYDERENEQKEGKWKMKLNIEKC